MKVGNSYTPHLRPTKLKLRVMMSLLPWKSRRLTSRLFYLSLRPCFVLINGSIKQRIGQCNTMRYPKLLFKGPSRHWCLCASTTYRCQWVSRGSFQNFTSCSTPLTTWNGLARRLIIAHNVLNHFVFQLPRNWGDGRKSVIIVLALWKNFSPDLHQIAVDGYE